MEKRGLRRALRRSVPAGLTLAAASSVGVTAAAAGFLDPVSILITIGGALGVMRATFSRQRLASAWHHLTAALSDDVEPATLIASIKVLARIHRVDGPRALEDAGADAPDPFLRQAIELVLEARDERELREVLRGEVTNRAAEGEAARQVMLTLGKLFPAFGLIGTLIGLVLLMRNLPQASATSIGPGLGIAVLTTLYGAILANAVVLPLATKLQAHVLRRAVAMELMVEGAALIHRREYPTRIERVLGAYVGKPGRSEEHGDRLFPTERAA